MALKIDKSMMNNHNTYVNNKSLANTAANCIYRNDGSYDIQYIVLHYTAGAHSRKGAARNTCAYFNTITGGSADFVVDDEEIMQYADYEKGYRSFHCGEDNGASWRQRTGGGDLFKICTNLNSIGIEMCSTNKTGKYENAANTNNWYFTDKVVENTIWLVKELLKKYPKAKITTHYHCSGKICPGITGWNNYAGSNESKLNDLIKRCSEGSENVSNGQNTTSANLYRVRKSWAESGTQIGAYAILENAIAAAKENKNYKVFDWNGKQVYPELPFESYIVKVTVDGLNIRKGPSTSYAIVGCITDKGKYTIVDEKDGWGKLKSGAGWIYLGYTTKV